jgi:hypothetical protein
MHKIGIMRAGMVCVYSGMALLISANICWAIRPAKNRSIDATSVLGVGLIFIGLGMITTSII